MFKCSFKTVCAHWYCLKYLADGCSTIGGQTCQLARYLTALGLNPQPQIFVLFIALVMFVENRDLN